MVESSQPTESAEARSEKDEPLRLQELIKDKNDPDRHPRSLVTACFPLIMVACTRRSRFRTPGKRGDHRLAFSGCGGEVEQVQAQGKQVLVLIWDNASQAG